MNNKFLKSFAFLTFFAFTTIFTASFAFGQQMPQMPQTSNAEQPKAEEPASTAIRVGVAMPKAQFSEGVDNAQMALNLREVIGSYFQGTNVEIVALEARLPQAVAAEAKEKGCAYILQTAVSQKKGGSGFGKMFGAVAPVLGNVVPMAGMTGTVAGVVASQVASTAIMSASAMASNTKSKDQFTFEYSLVAVEGGAKVAGETVKVKAKSDGEDVLSPMIEKMAESVVAAATK